MSHTIKLENVVEDVEDVEDTETRVMLRSQGSIYGQSYHWSKPLPTL
jgi:sensor c-di-GMP phosphodiesterase-like protein